MKYEPLTGESTEREAMIRRGHFPDMLFALPYPYAGWDGRCFLIEGCGKHECLFRSNGNDVVTPVVSEPADVSVGSR